MRGRKHANSLLLFLCVLDTVGMAGIDSGSSFTGRPALAVNVICDKCYSITLETLRDRRHGLSNKTQQIHKEEASGNSEI